MSRKKILKLDTIKRDRKFDLEAFKRDAKERLQRGEPASGKEGVFQPLLKQMLEEILQAEMDGHMNHQERSDVKKAIQIVSGAHYSSMTFYYL